MKRTGERRAGNPYAAFDVVGAGNLATVAMCTHFAIERAGLETLHLQQARLPSTLLRGLEGSDILRLPGGETSPRLG